MQVLVLSSEKKDEDSRRRRRLIIKGLKGLKTNLLNPSPGRPPKDKNVSPALFPQLFFEQQQELLPKADLVIADLTAPDYKIGFLVSQALEKDIPVLGLVEKEDSKSDLDQWTEEDLFFSQYFNKENIRSILRYFLQFVSKRKRQWGKMIVFDGTDGSGKATQAKLLAEKLRNQGEQTKYISFPRYYQSFHGKMVGKYLNGDFGSLKEVNPYLASYPFAIDRLMSKPQLEDWLEGGCYVVANRYTTSNMAFQAARIPEEERENYWQWSTKMEYKVHKLPKEDIVIFLYVPVEIGQQLVDKKGERKYVKGKKRDLHEENLNFLKDAAANYLQLCDRYDHWKKIKCIDKEGKLLTIEEIHQKVIDLLKKEKII
jgi:dTMP kinase